ncbi:MAG TPA: hypothetical protein VN549_04105 [Negativicutes bacterium]|nr:hypothetical protein [Negativicutes bacterium]
MITPENFLKITKGNTTKESSMYGRIDPAYVSGRPKIIFDGESTVSQKEYPYLGHYTPAANDRVMLIKSKGSYIVIGEVI